MFSQSWRDVAGFFLKVCLPLFFIAGFCIWFVDANAAMFFKPRYGNPLHLWAKETTDVAKAGPYFAIAGGLWLLFYSFRKFGVASRFADRFRRAEEWALVGFLSLISSGVLVQMLKHIIGRKRPYADAALSSHEFAPFTANYEFHSLPSGHSQVLFTVATVLSAIWPRVWWAWMTIAAIFSTTRVITLNHWVSDIVAGAAVGMFGAILTFRLLRYRKANPVLAHGVMAMALAAVTFLTAPGTARADAASGPLGVGIVIGDPTGLSVNYRMNSLRSIDGALAWSFGSESGFELHSDYLWHRPGVLRAEKVAFDLHYGLGARFMSLNSRHDDRTRLGLRLPLGLSTNFESQTIEVFAELALAMNIVPSTTADLDFGIGARIYF